MFFSVVSKFISLQTVSNIELIDIFWQMFLLKYSPVDDSSSDVVTEDFTLVQQSSKQRKRGFVIYINLPVQQTSIIHLIEISEKASNDRTGDV